MRIILFILCILCSPSCMFLGSRQNKQYKSITKIKPLDVIIVPGLPLHNGQWDTLLKSRIMWSSFLYKKGITKNIIYSGNAVYTKWKEGPSMALFALQLGVQSENIFTDTLAEHSTENLFYSYQLAKKEGFQCIGVASDPFQCAMLQKYALKNFQEEIYFLPIIYDSIRHDMTIQLTIDTSITAAPNFIPLEQKQNYKERLNGTRGKHIKKN